jgi:hypothetical protein
MDDPKPCEHCGMVHDENTRTGLVDEREVMKFVASLTKSLEAQAQLLPFDGDLEKTVVIQKLAVMVLGKTIEKQEKGRSNLGDIAEGIFEKFSGFMDARKAAREAGRSPPEKKPELEFTFHQAPAPGKS